MKIHAENWTFSHFTSAPLKAFISLGASPTENTKEVTLEYLVTLTDKDHQELFQSSHCELSEALLLLNEKYGQWEFVDSLHKSEGDGCTSCAAH